MKRVSVLLAVVLILSTVLAACGGAPADPAGVAKSMMDALQNKQLDQLTNFVCAAQRDAVVAQMNPASSLGGGVDPKKALDAMTIVMKDMTYTKTSEAGDAAVVRVKGTMTINFDNAKMTELMKAAGQDDATIQSSLGMVSALFSAGLPIDNDLKLVKENGKWLVCQ
jgi:major membrane immunogen (membrane-anchored lipoprotein)